jgi:hypothetical protein
VITVPAENRWAKSKLFITAIRIGYRFCPVDKGLTILYGILLGSLPERRGKPHPTSDLENSLTATA